ncbi:hypothetical protein [Streptomyces sp. NPDC051569]|uniref:hypothetical protein n=1 Tax=Streptomyces sp. NPDC051569 TaxID=3365661 RepID=UPI00379DC8F1
MSTDAPSRRRVPGGTAALATAVAGRPGHGDAGHGGGPVTRTVPWAVPLPGSVQEIVTPGRGCFA